MHMGIFSGLFRSRDKPKDSYDIPSYSYFFGRTHAGKRVNDRTAMQIIAAYACVRVLSEAIAQLPLHVNQYTDTAKKRKWHIAYWLVCAECIWLCYFDIRIPLNVIHTVDSIYKTTVWKVKNNFEILDFWELQCYNNRYKTGLYHLYNCLIVFLIRTFLD